MVSVAALLLIIGCIFLTKQQFVHKESVVIPSQTDKPIVTDEPIPIDTVTATDKPVVHLYLIQQKIKLYGPFLWIFQRQKKTVRS